MHSDILTKRSLHLLATAILVVSGSPAPAAERKPPPEFFQRLDQDHDGRISMEEFKPTGPPPLHPRMKQVFDSFDKDGTGKLSYDDTVRVITIVRSLMPKLKPDIGGAFNPVSLDVNPSTRRAFVKVTINNQTGTFLFDTGTSDTIIHPDFAKRAGVDFVEICQKITAGNMGNIGDSVSLVKIPELALGDARFKNFHAVMKESKSTRYETGGPIDGILGGNVIFAKPVTLDFNRKRMTYEPMNAAEADMSFPLLKDASKVPAVEADVDGVKVRLMFDSGAAINNALLINEPYHAAFRQLAGNPDAKSYTAKSVRVDGTEITREIPCLLKPFEWSVAGSVFFSKHIITVDLTTHRLFITRVIPAPQDNPTNPPHK